MELNKNVILATKSGWLIAATLLRTNKKSYIIEYKDHKGKEVRIGKEEEKRKLFNNTDEALKWIEGE